MSEVTVKQLAQAVGIEAKELLDKLKQAGIGKASVQDAISDNEKAELIQFIQNNKTGAPSTKRPAHTANHAPYGSGARVRSTGKKMVEVAVKKRKKIVRTPLASSQEVVEEPPIQETPEAIEEQQATEQAVEQPIEQSTPEVDTTTKREKADEKTSTIENKPAEAEPLEANVPATPDTTKPQARTEKTLPKSVHGKVMPATEEHDPLARKRRQATKRRKGDNTASGKLKKKELDASGNKYGDWQGSEQHIDASRLSQKKQAFTRPTEVKTQSVNIPETITVAELAKRMSTKPTEVIKVLMGMGEMMTINQSLEQDMAVMIVTEMGHTANPISESSLEDELIELLKVTEAEVSAEDRAPVVTIMGHVDHGKTSLLDHIRHTKVTQGESGGITQHIGAYHVETDKGIITFLDTPGHEAFSAMRARGANATDIVVLVVAADDGVMPQTKEAIMHAKAAGVPIVVAVNKIDKPEADPEKIRTALASEEVIPEAWGGDSMFVDVSAKTGQGIDDLLDSLLLQSEVLELTAAVQCPAQGLVVESKLDKHRGPVATLLVQVGTLNKGDYILAGQEHGKIRALYNEVGQTITSAGPSIPVEVLGLSSVPSSGEPFMVVKDERKAKEIASQRQHRRRQEQLVRARSVQLDNIFSQAATEEQQQTLNVIIKADAQGSVEAINESLLKLSTDEVKVNIIGSGTGGFAESDINLALTSSAILFGFNVRADNQARQLSNNESVEIRYYSVIYDLIDDVKKALSGMLSPELREEITGIAEVREVFRSPKLGAIAGCMVIEGSVKRNNPIRVLRDNVVIYEGQLESLRRFKDNAEEVGQNKECGIGVKNYNDVKPGDQIEVYEIISIERTID